MSVENEKTSFFEDNTKQLLAWRLIPQNLEEFVGQQHLAGEENFLIL